MSLRSFENSASSKDSNDDCEKNYEIIKRLGGGLSSEIYLATCKRGRLRRRSLVLKKVLTTNDILSSVAVHQTLCHPTILSLFSTFPAADSPSAESEEQPQTQSRTPVMRYIVLEHCGPYGTLSDHLPRLNPTLPLDDIRIRGVVKTLVDALTYLERENVVHRKLIPESVYVTEDFRVKLGGFDDAVRISPGDFDGGAYMPSILKNGAKDPQYHLAPEIEAGMQYDCSSDLWSLGILILWMLDPSREKTPKFDLIPIEGDLRTLVSQLLEEAPERRVEARNICGHPFLGPTLPVRNLDPSPLERGRPDETKRTGSERMRELGLNRFDGETTAPRKLFGDLTNRRYALRGLEGDNDRPSGRGCFPSDVPMAAGPCTSRPPSFRTVQVNRRAVSDPVPGTNERKKFLDPIAEAENESAGEERSAPVPRVRFRSKSATAILPPFLKVRSHIPTTGGSDPEEQVVEDPSPENSFSILRVPAEGEIIQGMGEGMDTDGLLGDFEEVSHSTPPPSPTLRQVAPSEPTRRIKNVLDTLVPESCSTPAAVKSKSAPRNLASSPIHRSPSEPPYHPFDDPPSKGTDTPRPEPFDTTFLPPQTHKVARGQLVVLPSRTLLVDFREGERRQGRQGVEVLTISPDGREIRVFSAPRMSTPCCLVEPSATYKLSTLPKPYWKLYITAGKLIEQIKQHIPRLVLYESDSKFTLMANFPDADAEVVFYSSEDGSKLRQTGGEISDRANSSFFRAVAMRIKVMRSRQLVEISRQVLTPAKVHDRGLKPISKDPPLRAEEGEWKKVVLVAPGGNIGSVNQASLDWYEMKGVEKTRAFLAACGVVESGLFEGNEKGDASRSSGSSSSILVCKTLPVDQHDNDRPRELESVGLTRKLGYSLTPMTSMPSVGWNKDYRGFPFEPPSLIRQLGNFETRFIPSVGWCVRYVGPSGGAGRYRMMFFDGKTLEVDVDEECVELMDSVRDEIVRYKIRECSSKREIMEKMRAFKEFVSMFDDDGTSE